MNVLIVFFISLLALLTSAGAQAPVAIVEDVKGNVVGAEFMDYVSPGQIIKLGATGSIVLGYMTSCRRETITGGVVVVGTEESKVQFAQIERTKVDCDLNRAQVSDRETNQSAATTFRGIDSGRRTLAPRQLRIYGLSPVVETTLRGNLIIERTDLPGERHEVRLGATSLTKGRFYDFAAVGTSLVPGGTYAAVLGSSRTIFTVDPLARPGAAPIISRLLHL
jgi:hypothetical protein